jgi:integrase
MAFVVPRRGKVGVYVYFHDRATGKQKQVPRKLTKHLDKATPAEIEAWLEQWDLKHGKSTDRSGRINLKDTDRLAQLWNQYQSHHSSIHNRRDSAERSEQGFFDNHILPFFVGLHENKRPEAWHDLIPDFHTYLFAKKLSDQTIRYVLWCLKRFGEHLVWSRQMTFPYSIQTPSRENKKITPLKVTLTPEHVLEFVNDPLGLTDNQRFKIGGRPHIVTEADVKLSILLGYFASLRPQEQWALAKSDFLTGDMAEKNTKTLSGLRKHSLGTKLSIMITKTWQKTQPPEIQELTKSHYSRGVVNVWHPEAAKLIAKCLKDKPQGQLFSISYSGWFQLWRRSIEPRLGVSAHDLRRASGQYLGRVKRIELTLLQDHLRHSEIETTVLYTRDPVVPEISKKKLVQNFDDVL